MFFHFALRLLVLMMLVALTATSAMAQDGPGGGPGGDRLGGGAGGGAVVIVIGDGPGGGPGGSGTGASVGDGPGGLPGAGGVDAIVIGADGSVTNVKLQKQKNGTFAGITGGIGVWWNPIDGQFMVEPVDPTFGEQNGFVVVGGIHIPWGGGKKTSAPLDRCKQALEEFQKYLTDNKNPNAKARYEGFRKLCVNNLLWGDKKISCQTLKERLQAKAGSGGLTLAQRDVIGIILEELALRCPAPGVAASDQGSQYTPVQSPKKVIYSGTSNNQYYYPYSYLNSLIALWNASSFGFVFGRIQPYGYANSTKYTYSGKVNPPPTAQPTLTVQCPPPPSGKDVATTSGSGNLRPLIPEPSGGILAKPAIKEKTTPTSSTPLNSSSLTTTPKTTPTGGSSSSSSGGGAGGSASTSLQPRVIAYDITAQEDVQGNQAAVAFTLQIQGIPSEAQYVRVKDFARLPGELRANNDLCTNGICSLRFMKNGSLYLEWLDTDNTGFPVDRIALQTLLEFLGLDQKVVATATANGILLQPNPAP